MVAGKYKPNELDRTNDLFHTDFMKWSALQYRSIVEVLLPGFPSRLEHMRRALDFLSQHSLEPRWNNKSIIPHPFHSHEDQTRWLFLKKALLNKDSSIIWCMRGGYGSNRLLPFLNKISKSEEKSILKNPKLLIGLSDITSLHIFFQQKWGWTTLHAPLLEQMSENLVDKKSQVELFDVLLGKKTELVFQKLAPLNKGALGTKTLKAPITGGNLTVIQSSIGTPFQIQLKNHFLFIEDVGERGFRIDRMLEQMKQAQMFKGCKAIFVGQFIGGLEKGKKQSKCFKAIKRFAEENPNLPIFSGLPVGHGKRQRPLPMGPVCKLTFDSLTKKGTLFCPTGIDLHSSQQVYIPHQGEKK